MHHIQQNTLTGIQKRTRCSGSRIHVAHLPTPKHSLKYLHCLAMKRKRQNAMDVDDVVEKKKQRLRVPLTVTETLRAILADAPTLE